MNRKSISTIVSVTLVTIMVLSALSMVLPVAMAQSSGVTSVAWGYGPKTTFTPGYNQWQALITVNSTTSVTTTIVNWYLDGILVYSTDAGPSGGLKTTGTSYFGTSLSAGTHTLYFTAGGVQSTILSLCSSGYCSTTSTTSSTSPTTSTTSTTFTTSTTSTSTTSAGLPFPSTQPTATVSKNYDGHNIWFADSLYWVFYYDGTNHVCRTSPNGVNWSGPTIIDTQSAVGIRDFWYSANKIFYVRADGGDLGFYYRYGTLSSGGCASIAWGISESFHSSLYTLEYMGGMITDSGGNMIASFNSIDNSGRWHVEVWRDISGLWTNIGDFGPFASEYSDIVVPLTGSKLALLYSYQPVDFAYGRVNITEFDGASVWTKPAQTTLSYDMEFSSALSIGDTTYFAGEDNQSPRGIGFWYCTYPCSTLSSESILFTGSGSQDYQANIASDGGKEIIVNYATVEAPTGSDTISYVVSTDGGITFGPPLAQISAENYIWNGYGSFYAVQNGQVCLLYTTGNASPYSVKVTCERYYLGYLG